MTLLTLQGWATAALCPRISGPSKAHSAPHAAEAAGFPPDHRLPLRAASRRSRPAAFRAQPAPVRQARPTFSPASIKLPLGPLAGGSCARARGPPTIYTPTCVMCASQRSAPLLGPTGRGKASTDPANEKQRPGIGVSRRSPSCGFKWHANHRAVAPCLITGRVAENVAHLPEALDSVPSTSEDRARRCSPVIPAPGGRGRRS